MSTTEDPMSSTPNRLTDERLAEIRSRSDAATGTAWHWFGNTATRHLGLGYWRPGWGRCTIMDFTRWGMQGAQPRFSDENAFMRDAADVAVWEVNQQATRANDPSLYRHDVVGLRHPDAVFIEHSRADVLALLTEVDRLRAERDALAARLAAQPPATYRDAPCPMARQEFDRAVGAAVDESRALDAGRADDLARAVSLIAEAACTAGPKQMGAAHALGILGEVARVGVGAQAEDVARALAARPAPDTLADRVQALAEEWERNYSAMLIGGFSGCSIGADTAAKRLRALLAGRREPTLADHVQAISDLIDGSYPSDLPAESRLTRRVVKVAEESGEVIEALFGVIGENPRKGVTHTVNNLRAELLDVAVAALGAVAHFDPGDPIQHLAEHAEFVHDRLSRALLAGRSDASPEGGA